MVDVDSGRELTNAVPLGESAWTELESGAARLVPKPGSSRSADYLSGLWTAVVAEFRSLHRDLALFPKAPASFLFQGKTIVRTARILERELRSGQEVTTGAWRLGRADGRNESDQLFVQYTISHAEGGRGARQTNLVLIKQPGQASSPFYPLPFDAAILEESDVTGRSVVQTIERDEDDAVFVGCLTMKGEKPTGSPTDFGVLLRQDGTQEWSGGPLARQSLLESARLASQTRLATERAAAAPAAVVPTAASPSGEGSGGEVSGGEVARESPRRSSGSKISARRAEVTAEAEAVAERGAPCVTCGAAVPPGARFCPACGTRVEVKPSAPARTAAEPVRCARCQTVLAPGARFCPSCGAPISTPQPASAPAPTPARPRCRKCGAELSPGMRFCSSCGESIAPAAQAPRPAECAKCRAPLRPDARFCASCGAPAGIGVPGGLAVCSSCGAELRAGARFCRRCGARQA